MATSGGGIVVHPIYVTSDVIVLFFKPRAIDGHDLLSMPYLHVFLVPDTFHFNNNTPATTSTIAYSFIYRGKGVNFRGTGHFFEVRVYKGFLTCWSWVTCGYRTVSP